MRLVEHQALAISTGVPQCGVSSPPPWSSAHFTACSSIGTDSAAIASDRADIFRDWAATSSVNSSTLHVSASWVSDISAKLSDRSRHRQGGLAPRTAVLRAIGEFCIQGRTHLVCAIQKGVTCSAAATTLEVPTVARGTKGLAVPYQMCSIFRSSQTKAFAVGQCIIPVQGPRSPRIRKVLARRSG